jgi:hypothetical protein
MEWKIFQRAVLYQVLAEEAQMESKAGVRYVRAVSLAVLQAAG